MKTVHDLMLYSGEIKLPELKKLLKNVEPCDYESKIKNKIYGDDEYPEKIKRFETKEEAMNFDGHTFKFYIVDGYAYNSRFIQVEFTGVDSYQVDDDDDYLDGGDVDWPYCIDEDTIEKINEALGR